MTLLIVVVILAVSFDLINGFHDAANSIATIVSTKVLSPFQAILWAAFFNVLAYSIFKLNIADTVSKTVHSDAITLQVILAGLIAAISWNLFTWWYGIPSSSSHTLIGGFAGAAIAHAGFAVIAHDKIAKTFLFIFVAPIMGMVIAWVITVIFINLFKNTNPYKAEKWFKRLQLVSSAFFSLGHGGNDSQKVMGIIAAALMVYTKDMNAADIPAWAHIVKSSSGHLQHIPNWIPTMCYTAMGFGTMMGGWRIVKTMGTRITKVTPLEGVCAESAGAITLFMTESLGVPVSTTHTITGSIIGVGVAKRTSAVRWGVTYSLLWAWILTIPVSGVLGAIVYYIVSLV